MSLTENQDQDAALAAQGADPATTPAAEPEGEKNFVDTVLAALDDEGSPTSTDEPESKADQPAETGSETAKDEEPPESEAPEDEDPTALTKEEMAALPEKTRTRMETLLEQRRSNSERATQAETEREELRPDAENYRKISSFMSENGLSAQDAGRALQLAALINNDPAEAFRALQPIFEQVASQSGALLPPDIAEDVRLGRITEERAQELSRARAAEQSGQRRTAAQQERLQQQQEAEQQRQQRDRDVQHASEIAAIGDRFSAERAQSDPDWKLKEPLVVDKLRVDLADNGMPKDEADLKRRFDTAVKSATEYLRQANPARPKPVTPAASTSSTVQHTQPPANATEAVLRALGD